VIQHHQEQMKTTPEDNVASAAALQVEFARQLGDQLDKIDFPARPLRAAALSVTLSVAKTQAYKLLKGMAFPSLTNFVTLRRMGLSVDEILDNLVGQDQEITNLFIGTESVSSSVGFVDHKTRSSVVVVPREDGRGFDLNVVAPGTNIPGDAKGVKWIKFFKRRTLAIIEDNPVELELLKTGTSVDFNTAAFSTAKSFSLKPSKIMI